MSGGRGPGAGEERGGGVAGGGRGPGAGDERGGGAAGDELRWGELEEAAKAARLRAYAPYSRYLVGAAVLGEDGRVYAGCNVENASYGLTVCAERVAVTSMVAAGCRSLRAVVVVTGGAEPGAPCGMCRQTLAEFAGDAPVRTLSLGEGGVVTGRGVSSVDGLLPGRFRGELVTGEPGG